MIKICLFNGGTYKKYEQLRKHIHIYTSFHPHPHFEVTSIYVKRKSISLISSYLYSIIQLNIITHAYETVPLHISRIKIKTRYISYVRWPQMRYVTSHIKFSNENSEGFFTTVSLIFDIWCRITNNLVSVPGSHRYDNDDHFPPGGHVIVLVPTPLWWGLHSNVTDGGENDWFAIRPLFKSGTGSAQPPKTNHEI